MTNLPIFLYSHTKLFQFVKIVLLAIKEIRLLSRVLWDTGIFWAPLRWNLFLNDRKCWTSYVLSVDISVICNVNDCQAHIHHNQSCKQVHMAVKWACAKWCIVDAYIKNDHDPSWNFTYKFLCALTPKLPLKLVLIDLVSKTEYNRSER